MANNPLELEEVESNFRTNFCVCCSIKKNCFLYWRYVIFGILPSKSINHDTRHVSKWPVCPRAVIFYVITVYAVIIMKTIGCAVKSSHVHGTVLIMTAARPIKPDAERCHALLGSNTSAVSMANEVLSIC